MPSSSRTLATGLLACLLVHASQDPGLYLPPGFVTDPHRNSYFLEPNGLKKAADKYHEFILPWDLLLVTAGYPNLADAVKAASLIVRGTLTSATPRLTENGCNIETDYAFHPAEALKGSVKGEIAFSVRGGRYRFPNGHIAELRTVDSHFLQAGNRYILFLARSNTTGETGLIFQAESAFQILDSGKVDPVAAHDSHPHYSIAKDVPDQRADTFIAKIRNLVANRNALAQ